jgi:hypothetical protein
MPQVVRHGVRWSAVVLTLLCAAPNPAHAQSSPAPDAPRSLWSLDQWRTSPFHKAQNADGKPIPCRCVFKGREYKVGEIVCMATHVGVVLARCDMSLNNTSWVPSEMPCDVSRAPSRFEVASR